MAQSTETNVSAGDFTALEARVLTQVGMPKGPRPEGVRNLMESLAAQGLSPTGRRPGMPELQDFPVRS